MQAFVATAKDLYRKPNPLMWKLFLSKYNGGVQPDLSDCAFVGDAAGRKKDISCSDRAFAFNIGVPFMTPEEIFLNELPGPFEWDSIDPAEYLKNAKQGNSILGSLL